MGVPTFYRWLSCRYPKVVVDVGPNHAEDLRREKANGLREVSSKGSANENCTAQPEEEAGYDCLYLDMNGIIHPCCHSDDGVSVFRYSAHFIFFVGHCYILVSVSQYDVEPCSSRANSRRPNDVPSSSFTRDDDANFEASSIFPWQAVPCNM